MSKLHIILTGGTIDSDFDPPTATSKVNARSIIEEYITYKIKPYLDVSYETLCMLDSKAITNDIRADLVTRIKNSEHQKIVITHGTDTMPETARYLEEHIEQTDKTIIVTGAMIPLREYAMSDAGFNMGYAIAQAQHAPAGIYIAMNANLFKASDVSKNVSLGRFEPRT